MECLNDAHRICCVQPAVKTTGKKPMKLPLHIPTVQTTPYELLRDCLNLRTVPKKAFLRALAECCMDDAESQLLIELSSKEGSAKYNELILDKGTTLLDLLVLYPSCKPKLSLLLEHLSRLLPRAYSIANSPLASKEKLFLIFSIQNKRPGITTQMLEQLSKDHMMTPETSPPQSTPTVLLYPRESNKFHYTTDDALNTNQLLIAIGTGIAPFLGFLQHKEHLKKSDSKEANCFGETWLFIGAKNKNSLAERSRLLTYHTSGVLEKYYESFSRSSAVEAQENPHRYVQDQMRQHANELVEFLMKPKTIVYVCGDGAEISRSIEKELHASLQTCLSITADEANKILHEFRSIGKYREDIWT